MPPLQCVCPGHWPILLQPRDPTRPTSGLCGMVPGARGRPPELPVHLLRAHGPAGRAGWPSCLKAPGPSGRSTASQPRSPLPAPRHILTTFPNTRGGPGRPSGSAPPSPLWGSEKERGPQALKTGRSGERRGAGGELRSQLGPPGARPYRWGFRRSQNPRKPQSGLRHACTNETWEHAGFTGGQGQELPLREEASREEKLSRWGPSSGSSLNARAPAPRGWLLLVPGAVSTAPQRLLSSLPGRRPSHLDPGCTGIDQQPTPLGAPGCSECQPPPQAPGLRSGVRKGTFA